MSETRCAFREGGPGKNQCCLPTDHSGPHRTSGFYSPASLAPPRCEHNVLLTEPCDACLLAGYERPASLVPEGTPPRYRCMACPLTFTDADSANAHHDATGHHQTHRAHRAFAAPVSLVPEGTPPRSQIDDEDLEFEMAAQCETELLEAQNALVLLANEFERRSIPFIPAAEKATAAARKSLADFDRSIQQGLAIAKQVFAESRAAAPAVRPDGAEAPDDCAQCGQPRRTHPRADCYGFAELRADREEFRKSQKMSGQASRAVMESLRREPSDGPANNIKERIALTRQINDKLAVSTIPEMRALLHELTAAPLSRDTGGAPSEEECPTCENTRYVVIAWDEENKENIEAPCPRCRRNEYPNPLQPSEIAAAHPPAEGRGTGEGMTKNWSDVRAGDVLGGHEFKAANVPALISADDVRILNEAAQLTREGRLLGPEWVVYFEHLAARLASSSGRAAEPGREERVLRLAAAKLRDIAADADRRGHDGTARAHRAHAAELESLAGGRAAGEGEALEKRVQAWGANLCEALGRRYPTMEEVVGASIAAIHESRRASETPDEEKLPHRPPQTEDGA